MIWEGSSRIVTCYSMLQCTTFILVGLISLAQGEPLLCVLAHMEKLTYQRLVQRSKILSYVHRSCQGDPLLMNVLLGGNRDMTTMTSI